MGANSKIEWTDHTFNPWYGCTRVSDGCTHCYAERDIAHRLKKVEWGPGGTRIRTSPGYWKQPLYWNARAARLGVRYRVFCASLADVMDAHPSITIEMRAELWRLIEATPHLDWLLLTKRPENWPAFLPWIEPRDGFRHVRLGVTIEHEKGAQLRKDMLVMASKLGWPTFISYEPALGPVDWSFLADLADTWLIAGGESGPHARPPHPDWFRAARDACARYGVPFFFKQWGEWRPNQGDQWGGYPPPCQSIGDTYIYRVGKKAAGRLLDGVEHDTFPQHRLPLAGRYANSTPEFADGGETAT